jgi:sucrose phosphorylase
MFDFVLNHISARSGWFRSYLDDEEGWNELAIEIDPATDLSRVTRPRTLPLLTPFKKKSGREVRLWTTFSADQVDINYASVSILLRMIEVLLFYVKMGATILRLDAIAYLWKQIETNCIHHPHTHDIVKLFRVILDEVAPRVRILTETNVPHPENIGYFGDGRNEAQLVYNFTLPPLLVHTFIKEDSTLLSKWASSLQLASPAVSFFNFTASHDGIGTRPLEGILEKKEIDRLIQTVLANGGQVSYKQNADGSKSPYELNITYIDACRHRIRATDSLLADRFLASQAIQLVLPGIPAIYLPSLLGSRNWLEGIKQTNQARTINRQKLMVEELELELSDPDSFRSAIFHAYLHLINIRSQQPAFHPKAAFEVLELGPSLFALKRETTEQVIYCLTNISGRQLKLDNQRESLPAVCYDLLSGKKVMTTNLRFQPYQSFWLINALRTE